MAIRVNALSRMGGVISTGNGAMKKRTPHMGHMADLSYHLSHEAILRIAVSFILVVDLALTP